MIPDTGLREVSSIVRSSRSFIEVGCGGGSPVSLVTSSQQYSIGIDIDRRSLERNRRAGYYKEYVQASATDLPFRKGSVESAFMFGVLDHLEKHDGTLALESMENIARRFVVVKDRSGPAPFEETGYRNSRTEFRASWRPAELRERGYTVLGLGGLKLIHPYRLTDRNHNPPIRLELLIPLLDFTQVILHRRPEQTFHMIGIKRKGDQERHASTNLIPTAFQANNRMQEG